MSCVKFYMTMSKNCMCALQTLAQVSPEVVPNMVWLLGEIYYILANYLNVEKGIVVFLLHMHLVNTIPILVHTVPRTYNYLPETALLPTLTSTLQNMSGI